MSAYQAAPGEDGTPGDRGNPTEPSHHGVNHKVSAWLQQTDDTDATSQGQNLSALGLWDNSALHCTHLPFIV